MMARASSMWVSTMLIIVASLRSLLLVRIFFCAWVMVAPNLEECRVVSHFPMALRLLASWLEGCIVEKRNATILLHAWGSKAF